MLCCTRFKYLFITLIFYLFSPFYIISSDNDVQTLLIESDDDNDNPGTDNQDIKLPEGLYDLYLKDNILGFDLGSSASKIRNYQKNQAILIKKEHYHTELMRKGEVIVVSIPARDLFIQNDTVLTAKGEKLLSPFLNYLKDEDYYRVLIVMHSDNTSTDSYAMSLTKKRINNIFDWFDNNANNVDYLIPYAMGCRMPVKDNNSVKNRDSNRRLEIYLVPGSKMVSLSKKGKL